MAGKDGHGTSFSIGDGADPEVFTAIANIIGDITWPGPARDAHDTTDHDSDAMEYIPSSLPEGGEVTFDVNFDPTVHGPLFAGEHADDTVKNLQIAAPDGTTVTFPGFLKNWKAKAPLNGIQTASTTWKVAGAVTLTPGV